MSKRTRALVLVGLFVVSIASACSASSGSSKPPATIDPHERDRLAVDAAVLQMSDLPGSWNTNRPASTASDVSTASPTESRDDVLTAGDACFQTPDGVTSTTAREYLSGPTLGHVLVRGVVEAHRDATTLTGKLPAFTAAAAGACLKDLVGKLFAGSDATVGDPSVSPSTVEGVGDERGGFLISVPVSSPASSFAIGADIVFARVDRFRATCTVINFDTQPDHALCTEGLKAMAHRLSQ